MHRPIHNKKNAPSLPPPIRPPILLFTFKEIRQGGESPHVCSRQNVSQPEFHRTPEIVVLFFSFCSTPALAFP